MKIEMKRSGALMIEADNDTEEFALEYFQSLWGQMIIDHSIPILFNKRGQAASADITFSVGDRVTTKIYGDGVVKSINLDARYVDQVMEVLFDNQFEVRGYRLDGYYTINDGVIGNYDLVKLGEVI